MKTLSGIHDLQNKKIVIATVGLADPNDKENTEIISGNRGAQIGRTTDVEKLDEIKGDPIDDAKRRYREPDAGIALPDQV